ncbi:hypothetical protein BCR32DRAFT_272233 [Anaeromyces robustus]|uniref:GH26 domain-containing protein n=1 Tax=Anaeromyces robustus TaxID=1754192 RepID=A0A1Y1WGY7_9FUNG|nr:hypothetical protein BCR32DRAFT_272233 [Anaeromyces robustus]|eukprot:ORX72598.1 hypothetical protein BCR32DRAFT_272233 [Anaeromyces robustus]
MISIIFFFIISLVNFIFSEKIIYEAENGILNNLNLYNSIKGYSGRGYVGLFKNENDSLRININIEEKGYYNIYISYLANMGTKYNYVVINVEDSSSIEFPENSTFEEILIGNYLLKEGDNNIKVITFWGWMYIDYIAIEKISDNTIKIDFSTLDEHLVNKNATPSAKKLYQFLLDNYGKKIISGQASKAGRFGDENEGDEIDYIRKTTGKTPALWNTDFIFESKDVRDAFTNSNYLEDGKKWWEKYNGKGIMAIQWHWNMKGNEKDTTYSFYSKETTFNIENGIIENTWEYNKIIADIDHIASLLKELQDINMPIIWRPLHENDGDWFWWGGKEHSKACAELWILLYKKLVYEHKINNLIWLWNGKLDENTPIDYIDLIGIDIYSKTHGTQRNKYLEYLNYFNRTKMVVLSENDSIPNIDSCVEENVWWGFFMTWNMEYILTEEYNDKQFLNSVFNSPYLFSYYNSMIFNCK